MIPITKTVKMPHVELRKDLRYNLTAFEDWKINKSLIN